MFKFLRHIRRPKVELPDLSNNVRVIVISPEYLEEGNKASDHCLALGITRERSSELFEAAKDVTDKNISLIERMVEISKHCKHPNELALSISMMMWLLEVKRDPMMILGMALRGLDDKNENF